MINLGKVSAETKNSKFETPADSTGPIGTPV